MQAAFDDHLVAFREAARDVDQAFAFGAGIDGLLAIAAGRFLDKNVTPVAEQEAAEGRERARRPSAPVRPGQ